MSNHTLRVTSSEGCYADTTLNLNVKRPFGDDIRMVRAEEVTGKKVMEENLEGPDQRINLEAHISNGIYFVKIYNATGITLAIKKLVVSW